MAETIILTQQEFQDHHKLRLEALVHFKDELLDQVRTGYMNYLSNLPPAVLDMPLKAFVQDCHSSVEPFLDKTSLEELDMDRRMTRARTRAESTNFQFLPETPRGRRRFREGEIVYSSNGSPIEAENVSRDSVFSVAGAGRRITLRRSSRAPSESGGCMLLSAREPAASMLIPLRDGGILDLDPSVAALDIVANLEKEDVAQLQESLLRFRQQTDLLLAQLGV